MTTPESEPQAGAQTLRFEHLARKQQWTEQPGNRYTAGELRRMSQASPPLTMDRQRAQVMPVD
jgi:hypothetical protein